MQLEKNKRWLLLGFNFALVTWGVLYVLLFFVNLKYGHFKSELLQISAVNIILTITGALHAVAFGFLFVGLYNGVVFLIKGLTAKMRGRKQVEGMVYEGASVTDKRL